MALKESLKKMADDPRAQLRKLLIGTGGAAVCMALLLVTSQWESAWLFYTLFIALIGFIGFAIPGYIGIWVWRMRDSLFRDRKNENR